MGMASRQGTIEPCSPHLQMRHEVPPALRVGSCVLGCHRRTNINVVTCELSARIG